MPLTITTIDKILARRLACSMKQASTITGAFFGAIREALATGDEIALRGFGKFGLTRRKAGHCRHPVTGRAIRFGSRRVVVFNASKILKERISRAEGRVEDWHAPAAETAERRRALRRDTMRGGTATVRVAGIPVCEFAIKDYSCDGTGFLVENNALILRNIWVGRDIEIKLPGFKDHEPSVYQRARVAHITRCENGEFGDCFIMGVHILSKMTVE
jgi:DNA-binding protein HU-beta